MLRKTVVDEAEAMSGCAGLPPHGMQNTAVKKKRFEEAGRLGDLLVGPSLPLLAFFCFLLDLFR